MAANSDTGESPHDGDEQSTGQTESVELELPTADIERIEFEIEQNSDAEYASESVEEWIEHAVRMHFAWIDKEAERTEVNLRVNVPPVMARRAELEAESARQRGRDANIDEILLNNVSFEPEWAVGDELIEPES
ncbi:hypothetical protein [Halococcus thailandensis]|uniref:Uncharacterized protein n=1 Tax=Halococcus thailandensis JCM 13552 TaxID=1227457 RepID=M0MU58_9EURY|nr:hypothetical protein [Halococcus thailandensis]EMA49272.1 hypothetical protein C451_19401 [Halococcus thailandensis JCM 13552]